MNKRALIFAFVCVAAIVAGVAFGSDLMGATYLADPKPGG